jgi:hypothetical protein
LYEENGEANTGTYKGDYLVINTKNPNVFEKVYQDASASMMKKFENQINDTLDIIVDGH